MASTILAHKVHPYILRIGGVKNWKSRWLTQKHYKENLQEDLAIKDFINRKFGRGVVESIEIERSPRLVKVFINTPRPGLIIGRGGGGVEELKKEAERKIFKIDPHLKKKEKELKIEIKEVRDSDIYASLIASSIAEQIEKRIPAKRAMKQAMDKIKANRAILGAKIRVAGRIDGATIARSPWISFGRLPLQTLRADIDYAEDRAYCTYGVVGIKVWTYKGNKM